jgi:CheY-like chemotaxis protein
MPCILVLDDDEAIGRMLAWRLGREHTVTSTASSHDVITRIKRGERFDVILCDVNMPKMNGIEVRGAVAEVDLEQARRIVFMTAGAKNREGAEQLAKLPNRVVDKPIDFDVLQAIIAGYLPISLVERE